MGKSLQIWCRMSMNFCECIVNILEIWSLKCIFERLNLRDGHPKKFGFELKILFVLVLLRVVAFGEQARAAMNPKSMRRRLIHGPEDRSST